MVLDGSIVWTDGLLGRRLVEPRAHLPGQGKEEVIRPPGFFDRSDKSRKAKFRTAGLFQAESPELTLAQAPSQIALFFAMCTNPANCTTGVSGPCILHPKWARPLHTQSSSTL